MPRKAKKSDVVTTAEPVTEVVKEAPKAKSTGFRSAVRLGEITAKDALKQLRKKVEWVDPRVVSWYEKRSKNESK
jgi:hypothetical protein